jgi:hypothetical protein
MTITISYTKNLTDPDFEKYGLNAPERNLLAVKSRASGISINYSLKNSAPGRPLGLFDVPGFAVPRLDGSLRLAFGGSQQVVPHFSRDAFPALEIYQDLPSGRTRRVAQNLGAGGPENLFPIGSDERG